MSYFIGLMSGTSMDAIDAALVEFGDDHCHLLASHSHPIPATVGERLRQLISHETFNVHEYGTLDVELGRLFAAAANRLLQQSGCPAERVSAIGSHGQTVFHAPDDSPAFTLQIGDPNSIAQLTGITTVADLRRRDMAAGGQGAPLAPAFHNHAFRSTTHNRVILNIGGIANITLLATAPDTPTTGFDTGPGNCLLDCWIQQQRGQAFDEGGAWAASGEPDQALLSRLLDDPYFARPAPKSTGREYFHLRWLEQQSPQGTPKDIQATLLELTVESIARAIETHAPASDELFVCGGGALNGFLMQRLALRLTPLRIATTTELGIDPEWVEAAAFAWLARQTLAGHPGNLPEVTGARQPVILGAIYPAG